MTPHKNQTPTQTIKTWISEFVTKPNPVFGNLPPCPYAQKAIVEDKVEFLELDGVAGYETLYAHARSIACQSWSTSCGRCCC